VARAEIGVMRVHTPNGSYDTVGCVRCLSRPTDRR
jgi:hypothetical protein